MDGGNGAKITLSAQIVGEVGAEKMSIMLLGVPAKVYRYNEKGHCVFCCSCGQLNYC